MRIVVVASFVAFLAACPPPPVITEGEGEGAGEGEGEGFTGVDPTTYCESIVDFFCPFYVRCGRMAVADADACRPVFLEACNERFEPTFASLANAGLLELDQSGIDACHEHLDGVDCDQQIFDLDGPCSTIWRGKQQAGDPCGIDIESFTCAPGTRCSVDLSLCGVCETIANDGDSCSDDGVTCAAASFCSSTSFKCEARKNVNDTCSADERCVLGATCSNGVCAGRTYVGVGDNCDQENRCPFFSQCVAGTCEQNAELGDTCDTDTNCDSGVCVDGTCSQLVAQGGACSDSRECQTGACETDGTCRAVPSACFSGTP